MCLAGGSNLFPSSEFFYKVTKTREYSPSSASILVLQRSAKLLVHEVGHLLGLDHCIHFACLMNGSGHLAEVGGAP